MRRAFGLLAILLLLLAACGSDEGGDTDVEADGSDGAEQGEGGSAGSDRAEPAPDDPALDAIEVSGEPGSAPTVTFEPPFETDRTVRRLVEEGDGEPLAADSTVVFDYAAFNGRDGAEFDGSHEAAPVTVSLEQDTLITGMVRGMVGVPVGSRVLVAMAPGDAFGPMGGNPQAGIEATDSLVFVIDVQRMVAHDRAEGTPVEAPDGLPTVELDEGTGEPSITIPDGDPPGELVAQPLIEGDGPVVEAGQRLVTNYTGVLWDDGSAFDSSWGSGTPAMFEIGTGQVVPGWDEGLVGRTVGSQVLLVVPPEAGYGTGGNPQAGIEGDDTLVFVVDILDAF